MNYYGRMKSYLFRIYKMQDYSEKYIRDIISTYDEQYDDLRKTHSEKEAYRLIVEGIKKDNPNLYKASKFHNLFLLISFVSCILCILLSFFSIMKITHCTGDSNSSCTITNGSPMLTVYSLGYDFCVILPLVLSLIISVIDFLKPKKTISIVNIIVSLIPTALIPYLGWLYSFYLVPYVFLIVLSILNTISVFLVLYVSIKASKARL